MTRISTPSLAFLARISSIRPHITPSSMMKYSRKMNFFAFSSSLSRRAHLSSPCGKYSTCVFVKTGWQPLLFIYRASAAVPGLFICSARCTAGSCWILSMFCSASCAVRFLSALWPKLLCV